MIQMTKDMPYRGFHVVELLLSFRMILRPPPPPLYTLSSPPSRLSRQNNHISTYPDRDRPANVATTYATRAVPRAVASGNAHSCAYARKMFLCLFGSPVRVRNLAWSSVRPSVCWFASSGPLTGVETAFMGAGCGRGRGRRLGGATYRTVDVLRENKWLE